MNRIEVRPIAPALGAEIFGVDLARPLDNAAFAAVHQAFLDHLVIFFRDQTISPPQLADFGRRFGTLSIHSHIKPVPEDASVIAIIKEEGDTLNVGARWHSDETYKERTSLGSMLYAKEVPGVGGDTMFANMYRAYDTLSDGLKKTLEGLRAVHRISKRLRKEGEAEKAHRVVAESDDKWGIHPVVARHPETGRKVLWITPMYTTNFEGWTEKESEPLLDYLYRHATQPENIYRFQWEEGSIAFWDNRGTIHYAVQDYDGSRRLMHRVSIEGAPFLPS